MNRYIINILFFSIIPLILIGLVEIGMSCLKGDVLSEKNLENMCSYESSQYNWVNTINSDSIIIVAGSSTVRYGLSCSILNELSSAYQKYVNIAMDARDPIQTYFIIKKIDLSKVSEIYFALDPWIYAKSYYKYRNHYLYLDFSLKEILSYKEHDEQALIQRYSHFEKYFRSSKPFSTNESSQIPSDYGSVVLDRTPVNFNESINNWFQIDKYGWSDLQFEYLQKIASLCKDNHVKFAVFITPKRSDFSKVYRDSCAQIHQEYVANILKKGMKVPIFSRFDLLDDIGDDVYFAESYHLNKRGQEKFSQLFYKMKNEKMDTLTDSYKWIKNEK